VARDVFTVDHVLPTYSPVGLPWDVPGAPVGAGPHRPKRGVRGVTGTTARARNGDIELAVERVGPAGGEPLLLIMGMGLGLGLGLGMQMLFWHDDLCAEFARAGFGPARFDNRDVDAPHAPRREVAALVR
jgi:hypothetical protein